MMKESYVSLLKERRFALRESLLPILCGTSEIVCEIGCGHGHFLTAYATEHPDRVCVGVDIAGERIERACRKRDRAQLSNLYFIRAEARLFLAVIPEGTRISCLFLLFPDPWPKLRHRKHRIVQPDFLETVADHSTPGCHLFFRTDFGPYLADAKEIINEHPRWRLIDEPWPFECESVFQQRAKSFASIVAVVSAPPVG